MPQENMLYLGLAGIFYVSSAVMGFFSFFGIYVLVKHGQSRGLALLVSLLYASVFIASLEQARGLLGSLR